MLPRSILGLVFVSFTPQTRQYLHHIFIMSSSESIATSIEPFDASSRFATPYSPFSDPPFDFDACMRKTYPHAPTHKFAPLPQGRKRHTKGLCIYKCLLCKSPWSSGNRNHAQAHLSSIHAHTTRRDPKQSTITSSFEAMNPSALLRRSFDKQGYKDALVGLLTRRRVPFSFIEWDEVRQLILAANPEVGDLLISSRRQALREVVRNYSLYRDQVKRKLHQARGPVHLTSDLWTSPHRHALLAITAQWVDQDYQLRKALIALPECRHNHSGEQQARLIFDCIQSYGFAHNLGCHTSDNASSNDTCVASLQNRLKEIGVDWDASKNRVRCLGHIINLSLQAFLFATSKEALQAAIDATIEAGGGDLDKATLESFARALISQSARREEHRSGASQHASLASQAFQPSQPRSKWQKRVRRASTASIEDFGGIESLPTLQKLHRLAVWVRSSSLHSDLWDEAVGLRLGIDNATRWSSWFTLIGKALKKKDEIKLFILNHEQDVKDMRLTSDDWNLLEKAHTFL